MARFVTDCGRAKPWRASRKREGIEYHLGYFGTRDAAREAEREFARDWPPRHVPDEGYREEARL